MKKRQNELNVDIIGGQGKPMTTEEQLSISAFIKKLKENGSRRDKSKKSQKLKHPA